VLDGVDIPGGHYKLCTHGFGYISDHKTREIEGAIGMHMGEPSSRAFGPMKLEFSDRYTLRFSNPNQPYEDCSVGSRGMRYGGISQPTMGPGRDAIGL
jgi:hypothetical protein